MQQVKCCPRCKRAVQAKDYMNIVIVGFLDSINPKIECHCGYRGFPVELSVKDYKEWIKQP